MVVALSAKCRGASGQQYLPDIDPVFNAGVHIRPRATMMWRLASYEVS
jgi:hypothetical protein